MKLAACEKCHALYTSAKMQCTTIRAVESHFGHVTNVEFCGGKILPLDAPKAQERRCVPEGGAFQDAESGYWYYTCRTCKAAFPWGFELPICPGKQPVASVEPPKPERRISRDEFEEMIHALVETWKSGTSGQGLRAALKAGGFVVEE